MGNSCMKRDLKIINKYQKDCDEYEQTSNSAIRIDTQDSDPYNYFSSPIDNISILDSRERIIEQNLFRTELNLSASASYEWNEIDFDETNKVGKYWFYGEIKENIISRQGILYYRGRYSEYVVEGNFSNNATIPSQTYLKIFKNGNIYIGELNANLEPEGRGEIIYENNEKYIGEFRHGLPHGVGEKIEKNSRFVGEFEQGEKKKGKQKEEKSTYEGEFKDNMKDGYGVLITVNGWKYMGDFQKNKRHGYGRLFNPKEKLIFRGFWKYGYKRLF